MDSDSIQRQIRQQLLAIETKHHVQVLYACESGSRAWGFPSTDSDYDVRFVYVHPTEWYLSIEELADTIEPGIEGAFDFGGWDIRKALRLLRKGNCPLIDWLSSPIVYHEDAAGIAPLKRLALPSFLPESACHHYLAMAIRHTDALRSSEAPSLKTYCYALRATLCARFIADHGEPPPVPLQTLLDRYLPDGALRAAIEVLIERKRGATESDVTSRIVPLDSFLQSEQAAVRERIPRNSRQLDRASFDEAFREILALCANRPGPLQQA